MPIQRFGSMLISKGQFEDTCAPEKRLPAENLDSGDVPLAPSVDWRGYVYDCDFNQMLELPLAGRASHARNCATDRRGTGPATPILVKDHCYGCTAGQGSSCGGALNG